MVARVITFALLANLGASEPLMLNKETFSEAIASGNPCFVKFFAPWQVYMRDINFVGIVYVNSASCTNDFRHLYASRIVGVVTASDSRQLGTS